MHEKNQQNAIVECLYQILLYISDRITIDTTSKKSKLEENS